MSPSEDQSIKDYFQHFDPTRVTSPCFVVDRQAIEDNLRILKRVQTESGAKVLAALKAFSFWKLAPLTLEYLSGTCSSGLHEARLAYEEYRGKGLDGEVHTYSAAFKDEEFPEILRISDHVVFNSFSQWHRLQPLISEAKKAHHLPKFGLRINPEHSEGSVDLYDPCANQSRLGITISEFHADQLIGSSGAQITGLHFHTLCEQDFLPLKRTLESIENNFSDTLKQMEWVNFGGGHHITRPDYQISDLIECIKNFSQKYQVQVYIEPGEAVAINTGGLVCEVLDIIQNNGEIAILDTSATCHMPDTLEMPYRADIRGAGQPYEKAHTYRLGGMTCLAGDIMGDYSFGAPLEIGQRLIFEDMAHYTMVKTSTFNGIGLPSLALWDSSTDELEIVKSFTYDDFKNRLS
ncbi:carboxynorspermidine decarboxylase [uncultured Cocleimonas sp.]|uniref:carboxynorspermidine decarboxylase n=1 Tax=uncultured Cocleimonas sp. TaxID=1051587 RepID=UPI00261EA573|nr:carboxynorspermidine decarboxylase [uncultured Cocleimonas sp.]